MGFVSRVRAWRWRFFCSICNIGKNPTTTQITVWKHVCNFQTILVEIPGLSYHVAIDIITIGRIGWRVIFKNMLSKMVDWIIRIGIQTALKWPKYRFKITKFHHLLQVNLLNQFVHLITRVALQIILIVNFYITSNSITLVNLVTPLLRKCWHKDRYFSCRSAGTLVASLYRYPPTMFNCSFKVSTSITRE